MSFSLNIQFVCKKRKLDDKAYHLSFAELQQLMIASDQLLMDLGLVEGTSMPGSGPVDDSSQTGNVQVHSVEESAPFSQDIAGPEV